MKFLLIYLAVINAVTFLLYGIDKLKAKKNAWRIKESTLLIFALIGGSLGALAGMYAFHHKTKHLKFKLGVPLILILQVAIAAWQIAAKAV